jgi:hypothetical protein
MIVSAISVLSGCSTVDQALPVRGYAVNVGSSTLREDVLLLNVVRASRFEPMSFVSLSKYNASGQLEAGIQGTSNNGLIYDVLNKGALAAGTTATGTVVKSVLTPSAKLNTSANFDMVPLENKEFYAGLLSQLGLDAINIMVNAGLSRELVLHSLVKLVRVQVANGDAYQFHNDPSNDSWLGDNSAAGQSRCSQLREEGTLHPPFGQEVWKGIRGQDCNYQKFLYFVQAAVAYGLTTEVVRGPQTKGKGDSSPGPSVVLCYDPAIAAEYGKKVPVDGACGLKQIRKQPSYADLGPHIRVIQPIMRSTYSVFQYYGRLLATNSARRVKLIDANTPRLPTNDANIFTVGRGSEAIGNCFASALHDGETYCVPRKGAQNTKEVFVLLNALVNLSTTRAALPTTQTVQIAP